MDITSLFGLPAHPFLVHLPILLIPLATIAAMVGAFRPASRRVFGVATAVLALLSAVSVQLAMGSGDGLEHHVAKSALLEHHTQLADALRPLAIVFVVLALLLVALDRWARRPRPSWITPALACLVLLSGLVTTARLVQVGHAGAKATWHGVDLSGPRPRGG